MHRLAKELRDLSKKPEEGIEVRPSCCRCAAHSPDFYPLILALLMSSRVLVYGDELLQ